MTSRLSALVLAICVAAPIMAPNAQAQVLGTDLSGPEGQQLLQAFAISTAATVVPIAIGAHLLYSDGNSNQLLGLGLAAVGGVIGPSLGSWYLDDPRRAMIGMGIRGASAAALTAGMSIGFLGATPEGQAELALSSVLISVSAIAMTYGLAYNFRSLSTSVRDGRVQIAAGYDSESGQVVPALVLRF